MSSNRINENIHDAMLNGLSAFDKGLTPLSGRYRSKSLSSDKLNKTNADRAAILEDVEAHYMTDKTETPGCLVINKIMEQEKSMNGEECIKQLRNMSSVYMKSDDGESRQQ
ncbi:hypothetical protein KGM_206380 [Danaus plexippus plexippus]|uniref:Uncharacterized protein n=1 Tax=Danaus plexippus plexippus TaxID=278856 RepID=A0A212EYV1_DANPL|nr:hypothetical protein KGM_206380 [Danaus plexippus plexippus]